MALSLELYTELLTTLKLDGHTRLAERLKSEVEVNEDLTSTQAAQLLGVSSANTVKNWMEGGFFPGAPPNTPSNIGRTEPTISKR